MQTVFDMVVFAGRQVDFGLDQMRWIQFFNDRPDDLKMRRYVPGPGIPQVKAMNELQVVRRLYVRRRPLQDHASFPRKGSRFY